MTSGEKFLNLKRPSLKARQKGELLIWRWQHIRKCKQTKSPKGKFFLSAESKSGAFNSTYWTGDSDNSSKQIFYERLQSPKFLRCDDGWSGFFIHSNRDIWIVFFNEISRMWKAVGLRLGRKKKLRIWRIQQRRKKRRLESPKWVFLFL